MWSKVDDYIKSHKLLKASELYIVALSGGADSVALLLLLDEMGYHVHAAHCNFHLRGAESDRDERFCEKLCSDRNIPFHRVHFDTRTYAEVRHVSIELAARELRYRWFEQLRQDIGADGICVAHHRDDSVETVLMNLVRGTGLHGLTGIKPRNGYILRPLLCVSRSEVEAFLSEKGQEYVIDSTNLEDEATRNRIRHHLVPLLQELNPKAVEHIQRMAERMTDVEEIVCYVQTGLLLRSNGSFASFKRDVPNAYMLYELLRGYGFNAAQSAQIYAAVQADAVGSVFSSARYDLAIDREQLLVEPHLLPMKPLEIPETGVYMTEGGRLRVEEMDGCEVSKEPFVATLDVQKISFPLTLRRVETGDWMVPFGMKGRKLLSDLMTDKKMSIFAKRRQLVVVDSKGVIVWVVGVRTDARVAVGNATSKVLRLRLEKDGAATPL